MLLTVLLWIYVTIWTFLAGSMLLATGRRIMGSVPTLAAPLVCLLGAAGLTAVLGWLWLLVPLNLTTHLVLAATLAGYAIWQRSRPVLMLPRWRYPWLTSVTIGTLFATIWLRSVQLPRLSDTGGYHAPMIEWIHQYAIVPGLANLNYRFGFNNSWFLLSALFRFQLAPDVPWHGLNGWFMLMLGWFSLTEWQRYRQTTKAHFSGWLGGWLGMGFLVIFHWTLSSPSPDLPTHGYVVLCFWVWLRRAETDRPEHAAGWTWLLILLSLTALTSKLSAVVILVLPGAVVLQTVVRAEWRKLMLFGAMGIVFTGYWLVSNVILSGYLAYPSLSPLFDWFSVDWKVPRGVIAVGIQNLQQGTRGDLGTTFSLAWVPYWFRTRPVLEQVIFVGLLMAPVMIWWYRKSLVTLPGYGLALLTAWVSVVFWFLLAPEIRFGAGAVLVTLGLSYGPVVSRATKELRSMPVVVGLAGLTGVVLMGAALRREPVDWLVPAGYPDSPLRFYETAGQRVVYPTDDPRVINGIRGYWGNCYDAVLPCSPYPMPGLRWRGPVMTDGFRAVSSISR